MADLNLFNQQDKDNLLFALNKVADIQKKEDAVYIIGGKIHSTYQRNEKAYRVIFNNSQEVHLFVFDKDDKLKFKINAAI